MRHSRAKEGGAGDTSLMSLTYRNLWIRRALLSHWYPPPHPFGAMPTSLVSFNARKQEGRIRRRKKRSFVKGGESPKEESNSRDELGYILLFPFFSREGPTPFLGIYRYERGGGGNGGGGRGSAFFISSCLGLSHSFLLLLLLFLS